MQKIASHLLEQKHHYLELRISIYGRSRDEWDKLALWFKTHKMESVHIRWLIQVPRLL